MKKYLLIFILLMTPCFAAQDVYQFASHEKEQRFDALASQSRCLVCQNHNIAESNAALANDLREQIYQKIQTGQSDQEIVAYLVARYGDYILYRPPVNIATLGLWFTPFLVLISSLGYLIYYLRKRQRD